MRGLFSISNQMKGGIASLIFMFWGAEVAFNGSAAGGVADVNSSNTSYKDCVVHDNAGAAFYFSGKSHMITDTLIFNQVKDFSVKQEIEFNKERIRLE